MIFELAMAGLALGLLFNLATKKMDLDPEPVYRSLERPYADLKTRTQMDPSEEVPLYLTGAEPNGNYGVPKYTVQGPGGTKYIAQRVNKGGKAFTESGLPEWAKNYRKERGLSLDPNAPLVVHN